MCNRGRVQIEMQGLYCQRRKRSFAMNHLARTLFIIICTAVFICLPNSVFASASRTENPDIIYGDDEDNPGRQLSLLSSSVMNGDRNAPLNPLIQLDFNKNIVNFTIARHNVTCYHLTDKEGNSVPINVILPDDQLQSRVKSSIFISPLEPLKPRTEYALIIDNDLTAKNGDYIDIAYKIKFTTGTSEREQNNSLLMSLGSNTLTFTTNTPLNENSVPGSSRVGGRSRTPLLAKQPAAFPLGTSSLVIIAFITIFLGIVFQIWGNKTKSTKPSS